MDIGGAEVVVVMMVMAVIMRMVMVVMVMAVGVAEQPGAGEIDGEAEHRDGDRFAKRDRNRIEKPIGALIGDLNRNQAEDDGAGESREIAELAGAEAEADVAGMLPREHIGQRRNAECCGMGRHVPAIGQQRHRSEDRAGGDLSHHHDDGQHDHEPGPALIMGVLRPEEHVVVSPLVEGVRMHRSASKENAAILRKSPRGKLIGSVATGYYHTRKHIAALMAFSSENLSRT